MEVEVSGKENNLNIEDNVDCPNNSELNGSNVADGEPCTVPENEDSINSEKQTIVENEENVELEKAGSADRNETIENSVNKNSQDGVTENSQNGENEKSQDDKTEKSHVGITESSQDDKTESSQDDKTESSQDDKTGSSQDDKAGSSQDDKTESSQDDKTGSSQDDKAGSSQDDKTESSQDDKTESSQDDKTEKSKTIENEKSQDEENENSQEQVEKSQDEEAQNVENGVYENQANDDEKDKKMDTDENEDDDDDDFNPLLLCPDISMDVDESPVLTGTTESSRANDAADPNSLFAPLFSTFVDEMTGAEISFNLTAEEQQLREKLYGPNNPIQFSKIHCTACNVHLGSALAGQTNRFVHPLLKVLICKECYHFYTSGEFEKDEDGSELYCRWCGQGGQVLCCTMCEFVFCKKCIRINFGRKKLTQVRDSDEWKCFRCDMSQLKALRAMCVEFFEYIRRETARAATYSDSDIVNKDLTNCCQSQSKKRPAETEKEPEKEIVRRPKRKKNEEDPDYNPYAQQSEDRSDSPVPSTSGVKSVVNIAKPTFHPKSPAGRNEVTVPTQIPSTVRIGNQVLKVKSINTPPQAANIASPIVKNTAIRTPINPTNLRVKPVVTPRSAVQTTNVRPTNVVPAVGSLAHIRATSKPPSTINTVMKHEWFEKTVRAAARVNSNLSYTLTQLNKAQSSASSVEQLAVVHNKLQEILSSSINSLIQIRKNLRTEFIAGIKTIRFPPKPAVDPNDDDVIIINPEPKTTPNATKHNKGVLPVPALVTMKQPATPVTTNRVNSNNSVSNNTPNKGYLKVRSFSQLQTVSSECITIPDDDPPPSSEPIEVIEESVSEKDPLDNVSNENDEDKVKESTLERNGNKESETEELDKVESAVNVDNESAKSTEDIGENPQTETSKETENNDNEECIQNGETESNKQSKKRKRKDNDVSISENSNGTNSNDSQKCNGNVNDGEIVVKTEPNEGSYNVKDQPTPKIRRMLSVKVNLKKTPIVENMVKQEPLENGDN